MPTTCSITGLRAGYGKAPVLDGLDLAVGDQALTVLVGAVGSGKSTLLSVISGTSRGWAEWETAFLGGVPLHDGNYVPVLGQAALKLPPKQRLAAVKEFLNAPGALLCLDEPTAGLYGTYEEPIIEAIAEAARKRAVLVVTHSLSSLRDHAGSIAILATGKIVELAPAKDFFAGPTSAAGKHILETGSHIEPSASAHGFALSPEFRPFPKEVELAPRSNDAGAVDWIIGRQLGLADHRGKSSDPKAIAAAGVSVLVDLDGRQIKVDKELKLLPMKWDMQAQDYMAQLELICEDCLGLMEAGASVALQSEPNNGAALLVMSAILVMKGATAVDAISAVTFRARGKPMTLEEEQVVWDFELRRDLQNEADQSADHA